MNILKEGTGENVNEDETKLRRDKIGKKWRNISDARDNLIFFAKNSISSFLYIPTFLQI